MTKDSIKLPKMKETDLARKMIEYFNDYPFDIYQEVPLYGKYIDIVVRSDNIIHSIECKMGLGFEVIAQARYRKQFSHYTSICVPIETKKRKRKRNRYGLNEYAQWYHTTVTDGRHTAIDYLKYLGIGLYLYNPINESIHEELKPKLFRKALSDHVIKNLFEQQKTYADAGSASAKRYTPFRNTVTNLERYVKEHPGVLFGEAIESIDTHYKALSTAKSALSKWIQNGVIKTIRIEYDGRHMHLYYEPEDSKPSQ